MILEWRNARGVRENMYTNHIISPDEHQQWWETKSQDTTVRLLLLEENECPLGFIGFSKYTGPQGCATWAFYSGDRSRKGIGSMMEQAALEYAFEELDLYRLECEVLSFNKAVVDFHVRHGFDIEGVKKNAYERDGKRHSIYQLAMLRHKWEKHVAPLFGRRGGVRATLAGLRLEWTDQIDAETVDKYSDTTGDDNPVHLDDASARNAGFDKRISHGMLLGGLISRYFATQFPGAGTIYLSQNLKFMAPVYVGDSVNHQLRVEWHFGGKIGVTTVSKVGDKRCVEGEAVLLMPAGDWSRDRVERTLHSSLEGTDNH